MHMIWCGDYQEVKTLELIWSAPWYSWIQGLQGLDDLQCFNCPWLGHLFPKLNCELWEYSKQTCMRYAELSIFSGLGLMSLGWGDYVIGSYRNLPIRNSAVCVEGASDPGDKLALCALGSLGFSLHCTLWGGLALCLCSAHDACVEGLVCAVFTEVSRVPSGHLTLWATRSPGPKWSARGLGALVVILCHICPGVLVVNLWRVRWRAWGPLWSACAVCTKVSGGPRYQLATYALKGPRALVVSCICQGACRPQPSACDIWTVRPEGPSSQLALYVPRSPSGHLTF